jgi:hypothetical protein
MQNRSQTAAKQRSEKKQQQAAGSRQQAAGSSRSEFSECTIDAQAQSVEACCLDCPAAC